MTQEPEAVPQPERVNGGAILERRGRVAWLRFSHPHRLNIITTAMLEQMRALLMDVRQDRDIQALVVTGRPDVFSGGGDLQELAGRSFAEDAAYIEIEHDVIDMVEGMPMITIAAVAGACVANAAELSLACDFRVVTESVRWGLVEVLAGAMGPAQRISRYVGVGRARELVFSGRLVPAEELLALGIATSVVPDGGLDAGVTELLSGFTAPQQAIRLAKENFYVPPAPGERARALVSCRSDGYAEAIAALLARSASARESGPAQ